jgi:hypothetical protein
MSRPTDDWSAESIEDEQERHIITAFGEMMVS